MPTEGNYSTYLEIYSRNKDNWSQIPKKYEIKIIIFSLKANFILMYPKIKKLPYLGLREHTRGFTEANAPTRLTKFLRDPPCLLCYSRSSLMNALAEETFSKSS